MFNISASGRKLELSTESNLTFPSLSFLDRKRRLVSGGGADVDLSSSLDFFATCLLLRWSVSHGFCILHVDYIAPLIPIASGIVTTI